MVPREYQVTEGERANETYLHGAMSMAAASSPCTGVELGHQAHQWRGAENKCCAGGQPEVHQVQPCLSDSSIE